MNFDKEQRKVVIACTFLICVALFIIGMATQKTHWYDMISSVGVIIAITFSLFGIQDQQELDLKLLRRERINISLTQLESSINRVILYDQNPTSNILTPLYQGESAINLYTSFIRGHLTSNLNAFIDYQYFNVLIYSLRVIQDEYHKDEINFSRELQGFYQRYFRIAHEMNEIYDWLSSNRTIIFNTLLMAQTKHVLEEFLRIKNDYNNRLP